ncbi:hypothetical protein CGZ80_18565 [Rhodopirellula sp. MGV]|nr:hypothetical protein CGZ80_18565 [Rhodopirellula sp. MGV]
MLIDGLLAAELGSPFEGPKVGDTAPDFCLQTHDGGQTIRLSEMIGSLPVVLVFGNFTCGPFRSMFTVADAIAKQFDSQAKFVGVYVREAHPVDGWRMGSNDAVGIEVTQPQTYDQRVEHACRCRKLLNASMPMLVDEIDDPTGHAYSGMPDRMYVIDRDGKVAFKSGRGPFGFKTGQMAQALVMALLEQYTSTQTSGAGK